MEEAGHSEGHPGAWSHTTCAGHAEMIGGRRGNDYAYTEATLLLHVTKYTNAHKQLTHFQRSQGGKWLLPQ